MKKIAAAVFCLFFIGYAVATKSDHSPEAGKMVAPRGMSTHQAEAAIRELTPKIREQKFGSVGGAHVFAEKAVRAALKTPATAKFPWGSTKATQGPMGVWRVKGEVDAQNGFGALVRHDWTVRLAYVGGEWSVSEVQIIPR